MTLPTRAPLRNLKTIEKKEEERKIETNFIALK